MDELLKRAYRDPKMNFVRESFVREALREVIGRKRFFGGVFHFVQKNSAGIIVGEWDAANVVTNQGLSYIIRAAITGETSAITTWYVGLNDSGTPDGTETYSTPVITELTGYSGGARPTWVDDGESSQSVDNSTTPASFSITTTDDYYGARLCGGGTAPSTPGDTGGGGTLLCLAQFAAAKPLGSGDTLEVTYTLSAADDGS